MQGAGGLIFPPATYWPEVQRICREYDVLLHLDEVITGFGRTGEWFGAETYAIAPDIMTMAKGLSSGYQPISAISLGARMAETILSANEELVHGFTYSGHPGGRRGRAEESRSDGEAWPRAAREEHDRSLSAGRLRETFESHPLVGEVRGIGMLAAIELVPDKPARSFFPREMDVGTHCRNYCFRKRPRHARHPRHDGARAAARRERIGNRGDRRPGERRDRPHRPGRGQTLGERVALTLAGARGNIPNTARMPPGGTVFELYGKSGTTTEDSRKIENRDVDCIKSGSHFYPIQTTIYRIYYQKV